MNIYQKLGIGIAIAGCNLSLGSIDAISANAATFTYNASIKQIVNDGYGSFKFSSKNLKENPNQIVPLLYFTFKLWGNTFTQSDFNGSAYFYNGIFQGLQGTLQGEDQNCLNNPPKTDDVYPFFPTRYSCKFGIWWGQAETYYSYGDDPNQPFPNIFQGVLGIYPFYYTPVYTLVENSDSDNTTSIPEPTGIGALLGLGMLRLTSFLKKKKASC